MPPESLACVSVGQVNLDEGQADAEKRVAERNARMRERTRVHDEEGNPFGAGPVDALEELMLGIALEGEQLVPGLVRDRGGTLLYRPEGVGAIDRRLARAEQIEVRAVQ